MVIGVFGVVVIGLVFVVGLQMVIGFFMVFENVVNSVLGQLGVDNCGVEFQQEFIVGLIDVLMNGFGVLVDVDLVKDSFCLEVFQV